MGVDVFKFGRITFERFDNSEFGATNFGQL